MPNAVKCSECGFLAVRDHYNEAVCETTLDCRTRGQHKSSNGNATAADFFCYRTSESFRSFQPVSERDGIAKATNNPRVERAQVLTVEIECDSFFRYRPGKSPKEHEEMTFLQEVDSRNATARAEDARLNQQWREEERQLKAASEKKDSDWKKQIEALAEVRHQEQLASAARARRDMWIFSITAGIIAIVSGAISGPLMDWFKAAWVAKP